MQLAILIHATNVGKNYLKKVYNHSQFQENNAFGEFPSKICSPFSFRNFTIGNIGIVIKNTTNSTSVEFPVCDKKRTKLSRSEKFYVSKIPFKLLTQVSCPQL